MSGPRRSSRHKKKDVQLVVSCLGPKPGARVDNRTSFYEIDIQSNIDCPEYGAGRRKRKASGGGAVRVSSKDPRSRTRQKNEDEVENPFVGESYPKFNGIMYEEQRSSPSQNTDLKFETQLLGDDEKEKERKNFMVNKKRLWTDTESQRKFDKHVKSYIIEHFVGEKSSELETVVQNYEDDLDGNEVHLHHHEHHHHHHYYANGKAVGDENGAPPLLFKDNFSVAPDVFYAAVTASNKEGRATETEESNHLLSEPEGPPVPAEAAFEAPKVVSGESSERLVTQELRQEGCNRPFLSPISKSSSKNIQSSFTSVGTGSGADFFFLNGGEDPMLTDSLEIHGLRVEKNKSPKTCNSLMESVKNVSHIMSPIVLTDHKTVPKIWYIRCKCRPWSKQGRSPDEPEARPLQEGRGESRPAPLPRTLSDQNGNLAFAEGIEETGEITDDEEVTTPADAGPRNKEANGPARTFPVHFCRVRSDDRDQNEVYKRPPMPNQSKVDFTKELEFEVWFAKLREELCEIKHQLKRIEEKRMLGNGSPNLSFRNEKPIPDSNQITVYSSRTFIVQPNEDAIADA